MYLTYFAENVRLFAKYFWYLARQAMPVGPEMRQNCGFLQNLYSTYNPKLARTRAILPKVVVGVCDRHVNVYRRATAPHMGVLTSML